jgi:hypothetical protein
MNFEFNGLGKNSRFIPLKQDNPYFCRPSNGIVMLLFWQLPGEWKMKDRFKSSFTNNQR